MKLTAFIVALMFTMTNVVWTTSAAATMSEAASAVLPVNALAIPPEMGSIQKMFQGTRASELETEKNFNEPLATNTESRQERFVVLVQDAHAVVDAQENIAKILDHLQKNYGIRLTTLEGARSKLDPTLFRTFPDISIKQKVLSGYLKRGEITGVQMASIFSEKEYGYYGIEDWKLYEENYRAYLRAQENKKALEEKWKAFKTHLDEFRKTVYSEKMNEFQDRWEEFRAERANLAEFLMYLVNFKKILAQDKGLSELNKLVDSVGYTASGNQEKLVPVIKTMAAEFKAKYVRGMDVKSEMNFYNRYQAFLTGQMESGQFLQYMIELGHARGFRPKLTPAIQRLLGHTETLSAIQGSQLLTELQKGQETIEGSLMTRPEEKELAGKYRRLFLLKELLSLELTHETLSQYQADPGAYLDLLGDAAFKEGLAPAVEFYKLALERDLAFYKNLTARMEDQKQNMAVVVVGGFHTSGLQRILEEQKISYAVVSPRMASLAGSENYAKVMRDDVSYKEFLKTTYYDAFVRDATERLVKEMNQPDFVRNLKAWRDDVIRDLSHQGRIAEAGNYTHYLDALAKVYILKFGKGPARSKEEILKILSKELNDFRDKSLGRIWQHFESQLGQLINGLKGLVQRSELTPKNVSILLEALAKTKPSMLGIRAVLDREITRSETRAAVIEKTVEQTPEVKAKVLAAAAQPKQVDRKLKTLLNEFQRDLRKLINSNRALQGSGSKGLAEGVLYPNAEESYQMLLDGVPIHPGDRIWEVGTGTGVISYLLAKFTKDVPDVHIWATEIDHLAFFIATEMLGNKEFKDKVKVFQGDLSKPVRGIKFNKILWNAPWFHAPMFGRKYGPHMVDPGYETILRFLKDARDYLEPGGQIDLLFPVEFFEVLKTKMIEAGIPYAFELKSSNKKKEGLEIGLYEYKAMGSMRPGTREKQKLKKGVPSVSRRKEMAEEERPRKRPVTSRAVEKLKLRKLADEFAWYGPMGAAGPYLRSEVRGKKPGEGFSPEIVARMGQITNFQGESFEAVFAKAQDKAVRVAEDPRTWTFPGREEYISKVAGMDLEELGNELGKFFKVPEKDRLVPLNDLSILAYTGERFLKGFVDDVSPNFFHYAGHAKPTGMLREMAAMAGRLAELDPFAIVFRELMIRWSDPSKYLVRGKVPGAGTDRSQKRSEARFQIPEEAISGAVIGTHSLLGRVVDAKQLKLSDKQQKEMAAALYELSKERFDNQFSDSWQKWLRNPRWSIYVLVDNDHQIAGAAVGEMLFGDKIVRLGPLMSREDEFSGKGYFLMDSFMSAMSRSTRPVKRFTWVSSAAPALVGFYRRYIESRTGDDGFLREVPQAKDEFTELANKLNPKYEVTLRDDALDPLNSKYDHLRQFLGTRRAEATEAERRSEAREEKPSEVQIDQNLLGGILADYGIAQYQPVAIKDKPRVLIIEGTEKGNLVLKMPKFRNVPTYIEWEASVLDRLYQNGLRVSRIQRAKDGKPYVKAGNSYFVLYEKLEGKNDYGWGDVDGEPLIAAAKVLAQLHQTLKDFEPAQQNYSLEDLPQVFPVNAVEHGLQKLEALHDQIQARAPPDQSDQNNTDTTDNIFLKHWGKILQWKQVLTEKLEASNLRDLPETLVHGDFQQTNMFFQNDGGIGLTDFEYAHRDKRVFDLANALILRFRDRELSDRSSMDMDKIERFVAAYDDALPTAEKLTSHEVELLPYVYALGYLEGVYVFAGMVREKNMIDPLLEQLANLDVLANGGIEALSRRLQLRLGQSGTSRSESREKITAEEWAAEESRLRDVVGKMESEGFWFGHKFGKAEGNATSIDPGAARDRIVDSLSWASHVKNFLSPTDEVIHRAIIGAMNEALCLEKIAGKGDMDIKAQELYGRIKDLSSQDQTEILVVISKFQDEQALSQGEPQTLEEGFKEEARKLFDGWDLLPEEAKLEIEGARYVDLGDPDIQARLQEQLKGKAIIIQEPERVITRYTDEEFLTESSEWYELRKTGARERRIMATLEKNEVTIKFVKKKWEGSGYVVKDFLLDTIGYEKVYENVLEKKYGFSQKLAAELFGKSESEYMQAIKIHPDPDKSNFRLLIYIPKGKTEVSDAMAELIWIDTELRSEVREKAELPVSKIGELVDVNPGQIAAEVTANGVEVARSELWKQGQTEFEKTRVRFEAKQKEFIEQMVKFQEGLGELTFVVSDEFAKLVERSFNEFGDVAELISRMRNAVVFGEGSVLAEVKSYADNAAVLDYARIAETSTAIEQMTGVLVKDTKGPAFSLMMSYPGRNSEMVLRMLKQLELFRLIILHTKDEPIGRAWGSVTSVVYEGANVQKRATNVTRGSTGEVTIGWWNEDLGLKNLGIFSILAEVSRIADPRLKNLACTILRFIFLKYASLGKTGQAEVMTKPELILADLNKMGLGEMIQFKGDTLYFDMQRFVQNYLAQKSVEQAA